MNEIKLTDDQLAELVWNLAIDCEHRPMMIALRITEGVATVKLVSNLEYKYEDKINDGTYRTLDSFKADFNRDLSMMDPSCLSV